MLADAQRLTLILSRFTPKVDMTNQGFYIFDIQS